MKDWIKVWTKLRSDARWTRLDALTAKVWIQCLLCAGMLDADGEIPPPDEVAWELHIAESEAVDAFGKLAALGWLVEVEGTWKVARFTERQQPDSDAMRAKRHRASRNRHATVTQIADHVTHPSRQSDAPVTPTLSDSHAEVTAPSRLRLEETRLDETRRDDNGGSRALARPATTTTQPLASTETPTTRPDSYGPRQPYKYDFTCMADIQHNPKWVDWVTTEAHKEVQASGMDFRNAEVLAVFKLNDLLNGIEQEKADKLARANEKLAAAKAAREARHAGKE